MRALCVGRHPFLSDHLSAFFRDIGLETTAAVGLEDVPAEARRLSPDLVLCEYDLLATLPIGLWEQDETLSRIPVVAVSLTRSAGEVHLLDVNGIAGFLYLPTLDAETALRVLRGAVPVKTAHALAWPHAQATSAAPESNA